MAAASGETLQIEFCTLGMFIIDDIYPAPTASNQTPQKDIIGGAGTYSAIAARLFSPPPLSHSVGWIVDAGTDFPPSVHDTVQSWETGVLIRQRPNNELTTRGWNGYSGNEHRAFKYLTPKLRLTAEDLTPELLASKSFHLICSPSRCIDQVKGILASRPPSLPRPVFIWEPVPDLCTPDELENTFEACKYIDIISPNHEELAGLFGFEHSSSGVNKSQVETQARRFLESGIGPQGQGSIVVRSGATGCYVLSHNANRWLPAYHTSSSKVIDPTGGGNGLLGGLAIGYIRSKGDIIEAARWGSVAASFCIEQTGMPTLETPEDGFTESWNGVNVFDRLEEYRKRTP